MTQLTTVLYATAAAVAMVATLPSEGRQAPAGSPVCGVDLSNAEEAPAVETLND